MPEMQLISRLKHHANSNPTSIACYTLNNESLTYSELFRKVDAFSIAVQQCCSEKSVVLLSTRNHISYSIALLGLLASGCTVFPISSTVAKSEFIRAATESKAVGFIGTFPDQLDQSTFPFEFLMDSSQIGVGTCNEPVVNITTGPKSSDNSNHPGNSCFSNLYLQSSGTTGLPKIVRRDAISLDSVAEAMVNAIGIKPVDRILMSIPLTHSYGLEHGLLAPIWAGAAVCLAANATPVQLLNAIQKGITILPGVPSTFEMILSTSFTPSDFRTLTKAYSAGAPLPKPIFQDMLDRTGIRIAQLYGATEVGSVTYNSTIGPEFNPATVGTAMTGVSIRILDPTDHSKNLPADKEGLIAIQAKSMFSEYLHETADLIDGHFLTGDLGYLDTAGQLFITGRNKLLIDIGGQKVNPLEVEQLIEQHPLVRACVVLGIKQSETINRLRAIIEPADAKCPPPEEELRQLCRSHLSAYKVPRQFEFHNQLPRSTTGKILRQQLE